MLCVLVLDVMYFGCSLEAFDGCFCLFIYDIIKGCVLTLDVVSRLFLSVNVFYCSLFMILIVWVVPAHFPQ